MSKKFFIAGVQFHQLSTCITRLEVGDELGLVPEPDNKYDPNAIKIIYDDPDKGPIMCGYVPKKLSAEVAAMLEVSEDVICKITKVDPSKKPWEWCEVEVIDLVEAHREEDELDPLDDDQLFPDKE